MKKLVFILIQSAILQGILAQKVDLDPYHYKLSYIRLPQQYVEPSARTYSAAVTGSNIIFSLVSRQGMTDSLYIWGYQRVDANPTVSISIDYQDIIIDRVERRERTEESKDKNGNVTSRKYFYKAAVVYHTYGKYAINGPGHEAKTSKFTVDWTMGTGNLGGESTYYTPEYNSYSDANRYWEENKYSIKNGIMKQFILESLKTVNDRANYFYGFKPVEETRALCIIASKKHPEYAAHQDAFRNSKLILEKIHWSKPTAEMFEQLKPVISYFDSLKKAYPKDEKADRKIRYASYYNLAWIYYWLDMPDKAMEESRGLVQNDYDTRDGEEMIKLATKLKEDMERIQITSRHMTFN